ncbi:MAG: FtsX-like permease family protein [Ruminococcus sp.]|nr:FtsX-like permease family protein [Ruminococcus sp.]
MFFKQIRRNASKSRKDNGLLFGSLIIAIVAFYTLLSLESQDVMRFLKTIESGAVSKLMLIIPLVYVISLFFVFFLVYFAYRYQMDNRKKEFGLYLMMGMKQSRLFAMLMGETIWNSVVSILIGLPIALLLTEGISLTTAQLVGIGIIGHRISLSIPALLGTVIGFIIVQIAAMMFLCFQFGRKELMQLMQTDSPDKQFIATKKGWISFILGLLFLITAYGIGILMLKSFDLRVVTLIFVFGGAGTFLLYRGMGSFLGRQIRKKGPSQSGLFTFTGRQIQENILHQHKELAIASLLLLMALSCISFGIGIASGRGAENTRSVDFSIEGSEQDISAFLNSTENDALIAASYPMFLDQLDTDTHTFSWGLDAALSAQPKTDLRDTIIKNFDQQSEYPYIISQTSYNNLLQSINKESIQLKERQIALYTSFRNSLDFVDTLSGAISAGAYVKIDNKSYELLPSLYDENIVADRKITLYSAMIVSDEDYRNWAKNSSEPFSWNVLLSKDSVQKNGLMQEIQSMENCLKAAGLSYESYISGIGRNLFYTVAASYLTIYLGVLFMLIANTVIGLKFLMYQRTNKRRYLTLLTLGAGIDDLCSSSQKQIRLFFTLVVGVASCSAFFAIWSMFTSFLKLPAGMGIHRVILLAGIGFFLFLFIQLIYINIVERASRREILALNITDRR